VIQGVTLVAAVAMLAVNLCADLAMILLNPRSRTRADA
jgi:ABC-type dipeptide/oligopeptide/nickel transport system permease component